MVSFQSTRPLRGATCELLSGHFQAYISIHAPLAGRDGSNLLGLFVLQAISIHAPLAGRDVGPVSGAGDGHNFNPRAPCGARRLCRWFLHQTPVFQSTRPLRGATPPYFGSSPWRQHFNPRAPCGARLKVNSRTCTLSQISIHAPLAGRDFRSTSLTLRSSISIHAPLAGRDVSTSPIAAFTLAFQSTRPLRGAT